MAHEELLQKKVLLLFEDDVPLRNIIRANFARAGYQVDAYEDPTHFLRQQDANNRLHRAHAIWTDGSMPYMSGLELGRTARELAFTRPIVLMTSNDFDAYSHVQHPTYRIGPWNGPVFTQMHPKPMDLFCIEQIIEDLG